jgi:hypothetical protein
MDSAYLWRFLVVGYLKTIAIETPILLLLLSKPHKWTRRLLAGVWLTACTYPIVILVLPLVPGLEARWKYLLVAETFAPLAECVIFAAAFQRGGMLTKSQRARDLIAIIIANIASFLAGEFWL